MIKLNDCTLDYTMNNFEPRKRATAPLTDRYAETSNGLAHLFGEREYNREATDTLKYYKSMDLKHLDRIRCPAYCVDPGGVGEKGCVIEVTATWPIDVAARWARSTKLPDGSQPREDRILIMNTFNTGSNEFGGNYLSGERGLQEEFCYRTSFPLTFPEEDVEIDDDTGVAYSAHVVIVRESFENGHAWLDLSQPNLLDSVSIASISVNPKPMLTQTTPVRFANVSDHEAMKQRWRNVLRLAGARVHVRLVLGLLGCERQSSAPVEEIIDCFKEVLQEREFRGGWFEKITFAVPNSKGILDKAGKALHSKVYG